MSDQKVEGQPEELGILWNRDEGKFEVDVTYGDARITMVSTSGAGGLHLQTLIESLPNIMHHVHLSILETEGKDPIPND